MLLDLCVQSGQEQNPTFTASPNAMFVANFSPLQEPETWRLEFPVDAAPNFHCRSKSRHRTQLMCASGACRANM
jgi:hypothetical protein